MPAQQVRYRRQYGHGQSVFLAALLMLLSFGVTARTNPKADSMALPGTMDAVGPEQLMQHYRAWDTSRIDDETAGLYASLSRAYAQTGDQEKAYRFFERYSRIKDSLFFQAKNQEINRLRQDLATAAKDRELAAKNIQVIRNQELANRKNAIVLGLAGSILLILILCLQTIKRYVDRRRLLKKIREQADQDVAISMLQASMQGEHRERDKIALQLHSNIRPLLQDVQLQLEGIERSRQDVLNSAAFSESQKIVEDVQLELENIATALASGVETQGLVTSLARFVRNIPNENALSVKLTVTGKERRLPRENEMIIYRMLQELIQNIVKHAQANTAHILMDYGETELSIRVQDDGTGFDPDTFNQGMGWPNIQERVLYLKGNCTRYNDAGTTILIHLPV